MTTFSNSSKIGYMYDQATDTWNAFSGKVNTAVPYTWQSSNTFESSVDFEDVVRAQAGVNNFQNPAARDLAIPNPVNGIVCFLRQDAQGTVVNALQYYYNGVWVYFQTGISRIIQISGSYTVAPEDAGAVIVATRPQSGFYGITFSPNSFPIGGRVDIYQKGNALGQILIGGSLIRSPNPPFQTLASTSIEPVDGYIPSNTVILTVIRISSSVYVTSETLV
jgi:hypothetical protein